MKRILLLLGVLAVGGLALGAALRVSWAVSLLLRFALVLGGIIGLALAVVLLVTVVFTLPILVTLLLQALGVLRRVPFSYNLRNLAVRWRVTALTVLAFTLVVGLMVVMRAFMGGMERLTQGSGRPE